MIVLGNNSKEDDSEEKVKNIEYHVPKGKKELTMWDSLYRETEIVSIPDDVEKIYISFFDFGYHSLERIEVAENNLYYSSVDGVLMNKDQTALVAFPKARGGVYQIPDSVEVIEAGAFSNCHYLKEIRLPKNLKKIGWKAFEGCVRLEKIEIPESITRIEKRTFAGCQILEQIYLHENIQEIGKFAFDNCLLLRSIDVSEKNLYYASEDGVLFNKSKTELIKFPNMKKGDYTIPEGVKVIKERAFYGSTHLTSLTVPTSLKKAEDAFDHNAIKKLKIGKWSFDNTEYSLRDILDIVTNKHFHCRDFYKKEVFEIIFDMYLNSDSAVKRYFKKKFMNILCHCVQINEIEKLKKLLQEDFVTEKILNKLIKYSIMKNNAEITSFLLSYKKENFGFDESNLEL